MERMPYQFRDVYNTRIHATEKVQTELTLCVRKVLN